MNDRDAAYDAATMVSSRSAVSFDGFELQRSVEAQQRLLAAKAAFRASKVRAMQLLCHYAHVPAMIGAPCDAYACLLAAGAIPQRWARHGDPKGDHSNGAEVAARLHAVEPAAHEVRAAPAAEPNRLQILRRLSRRFAALEALS